MKLHYLLLIICFATLTYWGLSQLVSAAWAVLGTAWLSSLPALLGLLASQPGDPPTKPDASTTPDSVTAEEGEPTPRQRQAGR